MILVVIFLVELAGIILSIAWIVSPEGMWWRLVAWMFRHPANVEPSDAGFTVFRIANLLVAFVLGVLLLRLILAATQ